MSGELHAGLILFLKFVGFFKFGVQNNQLNMVRFSYTFNGIKLISQFLRLCKKTSVVFLFARYIKKKNNALASIDLKLYKETILEVINTRPGSRKPCELHPRRSARQTNRVQTGRLLTYFTGLSTHGGGNNCNMGT